jgi:hypothetical protein
MFDVEVVVFYIGEHGAGQAQFAFKHGAVVGIKQIGVFGGDALALGGQFCGGAFYGFSGFDAHDVVFDIAQGNVQVLDPVFIVRVKTIARCEVEPRILRGFPCGDPCAAIGRSGDSGQEVGGCASSFDEVGHACFDGQAGEFFQLVIRAEQFHVHPTPLSA